MAEEIVGTRIKPTENTTLVKLGPLDQIKLLFAKISNTDVAELDAAEKLSTNSLKLEAALTKLFTEAGEEMKRQNKTSCTLRVSSKFIPYIEEVTDPQRGLGRYYDFDIIRRDLPDIVDYNIIVTIRKKVTNG